MNIAQLHERVKNLSDGQLANLSQRGDMTASLALAELNTRNDMREASAMQMGKAPTIAEQERAKAMQGIGAPPIDPSMVTPEMLAGIGNPAMMPQSQPVGAGVGQLEAPMMIAGGGLVALANGGQVIPFKDEGLVQPEEFDTLGFLGDQTYFGEDWLVFDTTNPVDYALGGAAAIPALGALGAGTKGLYNLATKAPKLYKKYKKARDKFDKKVAEKFKKRPDASIELDPIPRFGKYNPLRRYAKEGKLRKDVLYTGGAAALGKQVGDVMTAPDVKLSEIDEKPLSKEEFREAFPKTVYERGVGDPSKKPPKAPPAVEKGGLASLFGGLSPAAAQALIVGGLNYAQTGQIGDAATKGVTAGIAVEKQKTDTRYRDEMLKLTKEQQDLVYKAAMAKSGLTKDKALKEEREYKDDNRSDARVQAAEELKAINKGGLFGIGGKETTQTAINARGEEILQAMWLRTLLGVDATTFLDQVRQEKASRS